MGNQLSEANPGTGLGLALSIEHCQPSSWGDYGTKASWDMAQFYDHLIKR